MLRVKPQWWSSIRRMASKVHLEGIFPPVTTSFKPDGNFDLEAMARNFAIWNKEGFAGFVVHGSNGESAMMDFQERLELIRVTKELVAKDKKLIVGVGKDSTRETLALASEAGKVGVDAALVITPSFYKSRMTDSALMHHFKTVADNSPVPVILYNVPANTGVDMTAGLVSELAKHPNIIGLKDSGGDVAKMAAIVHRTKEMDFQVMAGSASFIFPAYMAGCTGAVPALANCLAKDVCRLDRMIRAGELQDARDLQARLIEPNACVTRRFGVAGLKLAMSWFGLEGGHCRSPLLPLGPSEEAAMRKAFVENGFLVEK